MDPIYIIQSTQKNSKYTYVVTEQEAKKYIREKAEAVRTRLSVNPLLKVYTTSDSNRDVKVLVQKVGNMWNGFLEENVSFKYFPVNHVLHEPPEEKSDSEEDEEEEEDEEDEGFIVGKVKELGAVRRHLRK